MLCPRCGHPNEEGANFCSSCGSPLPGDDTTVTLSPVPERGEQVETTIALGELPEGTGMVVVRRGPNAGSTYVLDQPSTTAGRHPDSDIFLDDITVSRRHAVFEHRDGAYVLRDVGSLNGTYVNRERVEEQPLRSGDELQIGRYILTFLLSGKHEG
jgi:pSer/pThr/pTyr-binding forkhead associated (FHA) protein